MKNNILPAIKMTLLTLLLFAVVYPIAIWAIAQASPNQGKGEVVMHNGQKQYSNVGQKFTDAKYFNSRPSAVDYNAAGSGASNKGASNEEYLAEVQTRVDSFLIKNPSVKVSEIPVDLITASGSGLDPNISVQGAKVQAERISKVRNIEKSAVDKLIEKQIEKPLLGLFGPEKINVLKLNIALDNIK